MAVVARGHVSDRPWARTVFAIAVKRFTGTLILDQDDRQYRVVWAGGRVVGADSPAPGDAVARVALTAGLVNRTQLGEILFAGEQDERAVLAEIAATARLTDEQVQAVARKSFALKALRIFGLPTARFVLDDTPGADSELPPLDPRWVIFHGLRTHYDEPRLDRELGALGSARFQLREEGARAVPAFGLMAADEPALARIRAGTTVGELTRDAGAEGGDRKRAMALVYALLASDYLAVDRRGISGEQEVQEASPPRPGAPARRAGDGVATSGPGAEIHQLIAAKARDLDDGIDHFGLLGVTQRASEAEIRLAYFTLAKKLHPDRLRAAGLDDGDADAHRVFATLNKAFAVLTDARQRAEYLEVMAAGGEAALRQEQEDAEAMAARIFGAEEAFLRGEMALRRGSYGDALAEFQRAVELNPDEGEHHALLGWAMWCAAEDKEAVYKPATQAIKRAITLSPKSVVAYLHRGRIAKQRGDDELALDCFRKVLSLSPSHKDAELEVRLIEGRRGEPEKKGFFERIKRR